MIVFRFEGIGRDVTRKVPQTAGKGKFKHHRARENTKFKT
jgi:hypothetical protein